VSSKDEERVLVVPTPVFHSLGLFQGFCPDVGRYLPALLDPAHLRFLRRGDAETDPSYKQLIPYVVLRCGDRLFHYTRGAAGGEARLRALRSIGVGGHICAEDGPAATAFGAGMLREVAEEVTIGCDFRERPIGLINDDATPVGQVHLGIVHVFDLAEPTAQRREAALASAGFAALDELRMQRNEFETWSGFLLEGEWLTKDY
jgi:predicted NUDIX family phosphoesterase